MGSVTLEPRITISKRAEVFGCYILFRPGLRAHETRHISHNAHTRINVDVDKRNVPIGLEVVRYCPPADVETGNLNNVPIDEILTILFGLSCQLAAMLKASEDRRLLRDGDDILREILESIPFLRSTDCAVSR